MKKILVSKKVIKKYTIGILKLFLNSKGNKTYIRLEQRESVCGVSNESWKKVQNIVTDYGVDKFVDKKHIKNLIIITEAVSSNF